MRARVGATFPLLVKLNSSDGVDGGLTEDDSLAVAKLLAAHGVSAIEVSGAWRACRMRDFDGEPFFAAYARRLARAVDIPVILTGGNRSVAAMERLVREDGIAGSASAARLSASPTSRAAGRPIRTRNRAASPATAAVPPRPPLPPARAGVALRML